jgi:hypothetical protein
VRGLVALHRGTIRIDSNPGSGTVVRINLPIDAHGDSAGDTAANAAAPLALAPSSDMLVLKTG